MRFMSLLLLPMLIFSASISDIASGSQINKPKSSSPVSIVSYQESIFPILKARCINCHGTDTHSGGLTLDTPASLFKGGTKTSTAILIKGSPSSSMLISYLRGKSQPRMPMNAPPLASDQIAKIETWIKQGAKIDQIKLGWPYTPPRLSAIPKVKNSAWVHNPIDNFILAKLEAKGLKPAAPASKITLLRRVYADLAGVPPNPQEAKTFLTDTSPKAYEKLVDRLLADHRYGERWGRHWLDLVRYADSQGYEADSSRMRAWRFRDYVIRSFNNDKPYDRFIKEQLAGDELFPNDPEAITATGYARLCSWDELSTDHDQRWQDYLNDATDTTCSVMLGLTVGCARCHDHKYDRISQADYYRMQAFFKPTKWTEANLPDNGNDPPFLREKLADAETHLVPLRKQRDDLKEKYRSAALAKKQKTAKPGEKIGVNDEDINNAMPEHDRVKREQIQSEIGHWESAAEPFKPIADVISDEKDVPKTFLLKRGNLLTPGPEVQPSFIVSLNGNRDEPARIEAPSMGKTTGRRTALANWIANADNPVTARVMVNRLWQHHFGRGIVATPSDFGKNGDKPTHPELLDWLAIQFVKNGWSMKQMHRMMALSNTYQMSTHTDTVSMKKDPTNTLFWRMNRIRLEGEALRDSILSVGGRLNPEMYGPGVFPKLSEEVLATGSTHKWGASSDSESLRRTIYVFQRRSLPLPIVEAFDGPDMVNTCPRRSTTTISPQALALFNGEFSISESKKIADRVTQDVGSDPTKQISQAYQLTLIRKPTQRQTILALKFMENQVQLHLQDKKVPADPVSTKAADEDALADLCHVLINTNEFLYLD